MTLAGVSRPAADSIVVTVVREAAEAYGVGSDVA